MKFAGYFCNILPHGLQFGFHVFFRSFQMISLPLNKGLLLAKLIYFLKQDIILDNILRFLLNALNRLLDTFNASLIILCTNNELPKKFF